jgi:ABC-2 type transport system ATP-binding protein/lipopolysaccharide transport system ATP-binding protein
VSEPAIVVDDIWKRFRVYKERPNSLKERITKVRRDRYEDFWALKGVSLEIPHGTVYGLVGHNGSGKSSLLRIMAGIHRPTKGTVTTHGRISALLELGAGFHPDLSGRENIYLNAAILGLSKKETNGLYDRIVDFSGLRDFIDTPVKHYSSGMYVRLGFAVAVHVDPQILLVDEVIAVGDEEFQRRCFDHLHKLKRKGVTIVLVTHGLSFVQSMCDDATWLDHGESRAQGDAKRVVKQYISQVNREEVDRHDGETVAAVAAEPDDDRRSILVDGVELLDLDGNTVELAQIGSALVVRVHFTCRREVRGPLFSFALNADNGTHVANPGMQPFAAPRPPFNGRGHVDYVIPRLAVGPGLYTVDLAAHDPDGLTVVHRRDDAISIRVEDDAEFIGGIVDLMGTWELPVADRESEAWKPVDAVRVDRVGVEQETQT